MTDDFSLQSPSQSSVLVTQKSSACSTSPPVTLRCVHEVRGEELAGQGWVAALCSFSVSVSQCCSAGMSLAHLWGSDWLNAHSVGGSGYRTKHTLIFLLKKVGNGFYVIFSIIVAACCEGAKRGRLLLIFVCHYDKSLFAVAVAHFVAPGVSLPWTISYCLLTVSCFHFLCL